MEFLDGFDHYTGASNQRRKWDVSSGGCNSPVAGRFSGSSAVEHNAAGFTLILTSSQLSSVATRTIGFAFSAQGSFGNGRIAAFMDSGSNQVDLRTTSTGALQVTRNGTVLGTSSSTLSGSAWVYIEFQATIGSSGSYDVHVGGVSWLSATGVNTQNTANPTMNGVILDGAGVKWWDDDFYCLNSSGSVNNTFVGDTRVITTLASADGASLAWAPNSGTAHYSRVNETNPDDDTSYVSSFTPGQIDTYQYPDIAAGNVYAVQVTITDRKDDTPARTISAAYRSGAGTNYAGTAFSPGTSYQVHRQVWDTDPATSAVWTSTSVNAGEFGVKCVS